MYRKFANLSIYIFHSNAMQNTEAALFKRENSVDWARESARSASNCVERSSTLGRSIID